MSEFRTAPLSALRLGAALDSPVYDTCDAQTKLLGAGVVINEGLLSSLRTRGIHSVAVHVEDLAKLGSLKPQGTAKEAPLDHNYVASLLENELSRDVDRRVDDGQLPAVADGAPLIDESASPGKGPYDPEAELAVAVQNEKNVNQVQTAVRELLESNSAGPERLMAICDASLTTATQDLDLFSCLAANPFETEYPSRHSLHVATLSIAIGARLGLAKAALRELALGCLLHDAGMGRISRDVFENDQRLSPGQIRQLVDHPAHTLELLGTQLNSVPFTSQVIAFQIHERCNGTGYPRGRTGAQIHELAKIAGLADSFVGLASNRPHRPGLQPYYVMAKLLDGVRNGQFDPRAMRGLLKAVSMFPIGSLIETNDGRVGRVLRSNANAYDRPIIAAWSREKLSDRPSLVDLFHDQEIKIVRPLTELS